MGKAPPVQDSADRTLSIPVAVRELGYPAAHLEAVLLDSAQRPAHPEQSWRPGKKNRLLGHQKNRRARRRRSQRRAPPGAPHDLATFIQQFDFTFRVPETLPGDWRLIRAIPLGKDRVTLEYAAAAQAIAVHVSASAGPDTLPAAIQIGDRSFVAARRHGVFLAFDRNAIPEASWNKVIDGFVAESP